MGFAESGLGESGLNQPTGSRIIGSGCLLDCRSLAYIFCYCRSDCVYIDTELICLLNFHNFL